VGYTIGLLKIMELRQKAQRELGRSFDIKEFHDLLIGSGAMPLPILERRVENWIAVKR
jgi:uncharacterized protein (DUF885 family)